MTRFHATPDGNVPFTAEEETEADAAFAAWKAGEDARAAEKIRAERNALLSKTDWRFRSDMNPSQAWKDYCQDLRDITAQTGFPWTIDWPTQPE